MNLPSVTASRGNAILLSGRPLASWTCADVVLWLEELGVAKKHIEVFEVNEIDGRNLALGLSDEVLKTELGIVALGPRHKLAAALAELR